jgi:hypothetical protein
MWRKQLPAVLIVSLLSLLLVTPSYAAPPSNDELATATSIGALPFTDALNTSDATASAGDPTDCTNNGSIWYTFTPTTDMRISAATFGSNYDTVFSAYTVMRPKS